MDTLYDLIGAGPDDDADRLKKAYRKAAKATHPDHHGDDPDAVTRFTEITAAYGVLRDDGQRAAYDRMLEARRELPPVLVNGAAAPRTHAFVSTMAFSVAVALTLSGALMFARGSGTQEAAGGTPTPEVTANETAAATTPEMPIIIVPRPVTADDRPAAAETRDGPAPEPGHGTVSAATGERTATLATASATASEETDRTASQVAAPAPAGPAEVARNDLEPDGRVVPAAEKRTAPSASWPYPASSAKRDARSDPRSELRANTRTRDPASTNAGDGRLPAMRRSAGGSAVERAALTTSSESTCAGSQRCPGNVPPLFGIGF